MKSNNQRPFIQEQKEIEIAIKNKKESLLKKNITISEKLQIIDSIACSYRQLNSNRDVYLTLKSSIKYLCRYSSKTFSFSIYCHYLEAIISLGFYKEAQEQLEQYSKYLKKIKDDLSWIQHYLIVKKLQYTLHSKMNSQKKAWSSLEAIHEIALFLDDQDSIKFSQSELKNLQRVDSLESQVSYFQNWTYLKDDSLALFNQAKKISKLYKNKSIKKIINKLLSGPMNINEFFAMITNKRYNHNLHKKNLEKIIGSIQKVLSNKSIAIHQDNIVLT